MVKTYEYRFPPSPNFSQSNCKLWKVDQFWFISLCYEKSAHTTAEDFLKYQNTFFKNTTYLNSMNMYFQNTTGQRAIMLTLGDVIDPNNIIKKLSLLPKL